MKKEKYIIYNDDICEYITNNKDLIIDNLKANDIKINDSNILSESVHLLDIEYYDLIRLLDAYDDKTEYNSIYVDADLGLWCGRKHGSKYFNCLHAAICFCCEDQNMIYFDKSNTTIKLKACHHDGCNTFKFYKIVNGKKKAIKYFDLVEA